jgi:hypothetical protein
VSPSCPADTVDETTAGEFLVELYVARSDGASVGPSAHRARLAAEEVAREGTPVRWVRSIFVPEDETCFFLYEAETVEGVERATQLASLGVERIAQAVTNDMNGALS